ncbi:YecA family protein [Lysinibacillus sp. NPDC056220]|uniref:YecA family protein n=1 Tax=Lysinibacillus sp. NPDC056220 TaxID=3398580 RepID=UPI003BF4CD67
MIGKNHLCYCGSGKKHKKCCMGKEKNDRVSTVTVDMGEPTVINALQIDSNGNICFQKDGQTIIPQSALLTHLISNNKDKVTSNIPLKEVDKLTSDTFKALAPLDFLFIIDTNTPLENNNGEKVKSACAVIYYQKVATNLDYVNGMGKVFYHQNNIPGEKHALVELIQYILFELKIGADKIVGIVTDHDLGNHDKYNSRELPLIEGTELFLPENFTLIYASADKKNENILTKLISECDKKATELLKGN